MPDTSSDRHAEYVAVVDAAISAWWGSLDPRPTLAEAIVQALLRVVTEWNTPNATADEVPLPDDVDESGRHYRYVRELDTPGTMQRWLCGCGSHGRWIWVGQSPEAPRIGWEKHVAMYAERVCENDL